MAPSALRVHAALITVSLLFGGSYVMTKRLLPPIGPLSPRAWVLFRIVAATVVLVPLAMWLRRDRVLPNRRQAAWLAGAALLGVGANQVLFVEGMARTTPEHSAVVNSLIPTWTLLTAVLAGQERLTLRRCAAVVSALLGALYLLGIDRVLMGDAGDPAASAGGATLLGDLLTMSNGIVFAVHLVMMRQLGRQLDPWVATAFLFVFGSLMIGAWSASAIDGEALAAVWSAPTCYFAVYVVLGATVLTYLLNTWALRHTHSSQVALYINVQPLVAAVLNAAFGAPAPDHRFFVALALVALGLWLQSRSGRG